MYDRLVKSMRLCGDSVDAIDECCYAECIQHETPVDPLCMKALCNKAADAIEQLALYAETMRRLKAEGWFLNRYFTMPDGAGGRAMAIPEPPKEETE